jgi:hypothetical protein
LGAVAQVKRRGILVIAVHFEQATARASVAEPSCLRGLAASPRYHFRELGSLRWIIDSAWIHHLPMRPPRRLDVTIDLPEHVALERVTAHGAGVAIDRNAVRLSAGLRHRMGFDVSFAMRALRPGYHTFTGPITLAWEENYGFTYREVRSPLGSVLALTPRRLATATLPVAIPIPVPLTHVDVSDEP